MNIALRKIKTMARHTASQCVIALGILCLFFPAKASAQSSNRWLFVFNTSSAMRDRAKGLQDVTGDLLTTGMHGNIRAGDTIGIWTYDSELRASEAPLQTWSPERTDSIVHHTLNFLSHHRYEKTAAFRDVLANMQHVIKISDTITVVLISDGSDPIIGTPFDASITAFYKTNFNQQRKEHHPIMTVFRGEHGKITTNTLSLGPFVDIPLVPPPPPAPKVIVQKPAPEAPKPVVASLVMVGRKARSVMNPANLPDITQGDESTPPAPVATTPPPAPAPEPAPAPAPVAVAPVEAPKPAPAPVAVAEPTPPPAPQVRSAPVVVAETPKPVETAPAPAAPSSPTIVLARESGNATMPPSAAVPAQPVSEAVTNAPVTNLFSTRNIAIVSVAFSMLTCVLLIIMARGARNARASLITRSLDRENR